MARPRPPPVPPPRPARPARMPMPPPPRNPAYTGRYTGAARPAPPRPRPAGGEGSGGATLAPRPAPAQRTGAQTRPATGPRTGSRPIQQTAGQTAAQNTRQTLPGRSAASGAAGVTMPPRPATGTRPGARLVSRAGQTAKQPGTQPGKQTQAAANTTMARSAAVAAPRAPQRAAAPSARREAARREAARRGVPGAQRRPPKARKAPPPGRRPRAPRSAGGNTHHWGQGRALWGVVLLLLLVVGAIGGYYGYLWHEFNAEGPAPAAVRLQVSQGASLKGVLNQLAGQGALGDKLGTLMYLRLTGEDPRVKVGTYEFPAHASPAKIIAMLNDGKVVLEQVTVIEGSTFADFRRTLDESPVVTHALRGKSDAQVMAALGHGGEVPEGRFFPDTYLFAAQTSDLEILQIAYNKMQHLLDKEWPGHEASLPYSTPYEALTMASLVEKETGVPAERPRIAGVFINRLRKGMRLQTDPAVIYGLGPAYDGSIHKKDLETDNPYNTYTRNGLPPTPIALPGREAVLAAIHPDNTDALYFVATGNGGHHFSATLEEHNAAVRSWLLRRAQGGSAGAQ